MSKVNLRRKSDPNYNLTTLFSGTVLKPNYSFLFLACIAAVFLGVNSLNAQEKAKIYGQVIDAETGETLIGANIRIEGTLIGAATDIDGRYSMENIEPGTYNVIFSFISFQTKIVSDVVLEAGQSLKLDVTLEVETFDLGEEVVVTAQAITNSDGALLRVRQKAISFSDAISAESISKSGSGDAAAAMKKVVGASVVGGKYVYVRGLGDRYSSSHLNGVELPSADPDKKSFQLDIFPANLLENIVTIKSFTPDKPGNFSGGLVNVNTKDFPESRTFNFSYSTSYNTQASLADGILPTSGNDDIFGKDDGTRALPSILVPLTEDPSIIIPSTVAARFNTEDAYTIDRYSRAFNSDMLPNNVTLPMNTSFNISYGDAVKLFGNDLGFSGTITYNRSATNYTNGETGRWQMIGPLATAESLTNLFDLGDSRSQQNVDIGGLASLSYKLNDNNRLSFNYLNTRSGSNTGRMLSGIWTDEVPNDTYNSSVMQYTERTLNSLQFRGKHYLPSILDATIEWNYSTAENTQEEPDLRFFTYIEDDEGNLSTTSALIQRPARFFRDLTESNDNAFIDLSIPFNSFGGNQGKFKTGYYLQETDREFNEFRFEYNIGNDPLTNYAENLNEFFNYLGVVDSTALGSTGTMRYTFGNTIRNGTNPKNQYIADQRIEAAYLMLELPLTSTFKVIGGVRMEDTQINTVSADTTLPIGELDNTDYLPSISAIYNLNENMNLRASYTNTLARPTFRELAPYVTFDFVGDFLFSGNESLKRTLIKNADLRWEWFPRASEIVAVSAFYKHLDNPIERLIRVDVNRSQTVQNVDEGIVWGLEFEFRKNLDVLSEALRYFTFSSNFTYVQSEVTIPETEMEIIRINDPEAENKRQLVGQSPYLLNIDLSYDNPDNGLNVNASFNRFGDRLQAVALGAIPDIFERSFSTLDVVANKNIGQRFKVKASLRNLLDPDIKVSHILNGEEFIYQSFKRGRTFSLGLSYSF